MDSFRILEQLIQFTNMRHGVLTSNIANADTPGYKAKDVSFKQTLNDEMELRTTNVRHIKTGGSGSSGEVENGTANAWADGNTVELDMEVAKMTENSMLYQAGISMLSTKIRMFKTALRR
jgi:flagellar basal-body rod protein FlgB